MTYFVLFVLVSGNHPRFEVPDGIYVVGTYSSESQCDWVKSTFTDFEYAAMCVEETVKDLHT